MRLFFRSIHLPRLTFHKHGEEEKKEVRLRLIVTDGWQFSIVKILSNIYSRRSEAIMSVRLELEISCTGRLIEAPSGDDLRRRRSTLT